MLQRGVYCIELCNAQLAHLCLVFRFGDFKCQVLLVILLMQFSRNVQRATATRGEKRYSGTKLRHISAQDVTPIPPP